MRFTSFIILFFLIQNIYSQGLFSSNKKKEPLVKVTKTGPYFGLQRGKYNNIELGCELRRKGIKLVKPVTNAFNIGFDYNLNQNILGFSAGYWRKKGRLNFTYGGMIVYKSNFTENRIGFSPTVGYKVSLLHLLVGYNMLIPAHNINTNSLFISLRLVLVNSRKFKWRKRKKNKK